MRCPKFDVSMYPQSRLRSTCLGSNEHLDSPRLEQPLHNALVLLLESLVVVPNTVLQGLHEPLVVDMVEMRLEVVELDVEEAVAVRVRAAVRDDVVCGQPALATRGDEDDDRLCWRVLDHSEICGLGHGDHQRGEVRNAEALEVDVHIQRAGTENETSATSRSNAK